VALVDDEQIPREVWRTCGRVTGGEELVEDVGLAEVVVRRDGSAERAPRVGVHPEPFAEAVGLTTIDEVKGERELLPQLVAPLQP